MSAVAGMVAPFLVGAATGGWLSRRRAVGRAVGAALAAAEGGRAAAMAQGNVVYVSTGTGEQVLAVPSNLPARRVPVPATYVDPYAYDYDEDVEHALIADTRRQLSPSEQRVVDAMLERFNAGAFAPPELGS